MAMLTPTIFISDMNAAPTPADQDHAVRDTIEMLGLVDLTANLEGHHLTFPTKRRPPPPAWTYATATPAPSSGQRPDTAPSQWDSQATGPCTSASASLTSPPPPRKMRTKAYHRP